MIGIPTSSQRPASRESDTYLSSKMLHLHHLFTVAAIYARAVLATQVKPRMPREIRASESAHYTHLQTFSTDE